MKFSATFGVLIAFLLPGFLCLYGLSFRAEALADLLDVSGQTASSADFLYTALASLSIGLILNAVRWAVLDNIFHRLFHLKWPDGINWDRLSDEHALAGFQLIVENHYHYYQYYSNTFVAILTALVYNALAPGSLGWLTWLFWLAVLLVLLIGSWDTLRRYYARATPILSKGSSS